MGLNINKGFSGGKKIRSLIALPNHLRPTLSKKGLKKGVSRHAETFKDRLMLTDVGEIFLELIRKRHSGFKIDLVNSRDYYPWCLSFTLNRYRVTLQSEVIGTSNWQSFIVFEPSTFRNSSDKKDYIVLMKQFLKAMKRDPCNSMYWSTEDWEEFYSLRALNKTKMDSMWKFNRAEV